MTKVSAYEYILVKGMCSCSLSFQQQMMIANSAAANSTTTHINMLTHYTYIYSAFVDYLIYLMILLSAKKMNLFEAEAALASILQRRGHKCNIQ